MARTYHTLCIWDQDQAGWFDSFGSYSLKEVKAEYQAAWEGGYRKAHLALISTGELAVDMITARDSLPHPKG